MICAIIQLNVFNSFDRMTDHISHQSVKKKWNVSLRVTPEEEQRIKITAIKMGMRVGEYIKQAALEDFSIKKQHTHGDF